MGKVTVDISLTLLWAGADKSTITLNFPGVLFRITAIQLVTTFEHT